MRVLTVVSEDEVWGHYLLQLFESRFHLGTHKRHESVRKNFQQRPSQGGGTDEQRSRASRLSLPDSNGAKHYPVKHTARILLGQTKDGAATANFDIVGMRAQAQDL